MTAQRGVLRKIALSAASNVWKRYGFHTMRIHPEMRKAIVLLLKAGGVFAVILTAALVAAWLFIGWTDEGAADYAGGVVLRDAGGEVLRVSLGEGDVDCRPYYVADPDDWIVPGSRQFITMLREKGIHCLVASGTDDADVQREAQLLKIDELFDGGVFGARDDLSVNRKESEIREIKAMVIEDLLEKEGIDPSELISFGDGYVEVQLVAERGGLAIGVATNEDTRTGINEWKRGRLIVAGARAIAPDFSQPEELMRLLDYK